MPRPAISLDLNLAAASPLPRCTRRIKIFRYCYLPFQGPGQVNIYTIDIVIIIVQNADAQPPHTPPLELGFQIKCADLEHNPSVLFSTCLVCSTSTQRMNI